MLCVEDTEAEDCGFDGTVFLAYIDAASVGAGVQVSQMHTQLHVTGAVAFVWPAMSVVCNLFIHMLQS